MATRNFHFPAVPSDVVEDRFGYHPPNNDKIKEGHEQIRAWAGEFAVNLNENLPECDEKHKALERLQEVMFWANAAVALNQEFAGEQE